MALKRKWKNRQKEIKDWIKKERKGSKVGEWKSGEEKVQMGDFCCPWRGQKDSAGTLQNETCMSCSRFLLSSCPVFPKPHDKHSPWVLNHGSRGPPHEALMNFRHEKAGVISEVNPTRAEPHSSQLSSKTTGQDWKTEMLRAKRETERRKERVGGGRKTNILLMQRRLIQTLADRSMFTLHSRS